MRWAVEYALTTGTIGLMIFTAQDIEEAEQYVLEKEGEVRQCRDSGKSKSHQGLAWCIR